MPLCYSGISRDMVEETWAPLCSCVAHQAFIHEVSRSVTDYTGALIRGVRRPECNFGFWKLVRLTGFNLWIPEMYPKGFCDGFDMQMCHSLTLR